MKDLKKACDCKYILLLISCIFSLWLTGFAQSDTLKTKGKKLDHISLALTNNHSAFPFSSFGKLVTGTWHPGVEMGTGFNWRERKKHDWYQEFKLGYFYHQFIQHGIPLYTNFGYRYKFSKHWSAQTGIGAGVLFSIPDQDRYKLNDNGNYEKISTLRTQGMFVFNIGTGYKMLLTKKFPLEVFLTYQQRIQTPYVPSYVPLLPYNSLMLGAKMSLH